MEETYLIIKPIGKKMSPHIYPLLEKAVEEGGGRRTVSGLGFAVKRYKDDSVFVSKGYTDPTMMVQTIKAMRINKKDFLTVSIRFTQENDPCRGMNAQPMVVELDSESIPSQSTGMVDECSIAIFATKPLYRFQSHAIPYCSLIMACKKFFSRKKIMLALLELLEYKKPTHYVNSIDFLKFNKFVFMTSLRKPIYCGEGWVTDNHGIIHSTAEFINAHKKAKDKPVIDFTLTHQ